MTTQVEIVQETVKNDNEMINLQISDDRKVYLVDINKPINSDGNLNLWRIWLKNDLPVQLAIFRQIAENWSIIGESALENANQGLNEWTLSHPIPVKVGDCVGLYYPHNENSGTEKPANVDTEKKPQSILNFDGQDDYISLPPSSSGGAITIEAWVYLKNASHNWQRVVDFGNGPNKENIILAWSGTTGKMALNTRSGGAETQIVTDEVFPNKKWVHVVGVNDGNGNAHIYWNGELKASGNNLVCPSNITRNNQYIGRSNWDSDGYFIGKITEVRIWNTARTQDEITQYIDHRLTGKEEGLMAYYPLNGDASDSTSNKNHGTIHGGTWTQENLEFLEPLKRTEKPANVDREQNPQSVLNFDGQDDYIEIQEPFENNRYFTISLWINPAILNSNFRGFIGKQEEAYRQPGMWVGPSGNELHYDSYDTSGQRYFSILNNFFESKDKWVHIAWVKENTEYKIYRNGELFAMEPAPTNFYTTNTNYWLGRVDNFFQGKITEVRIWNKARTQDEITQDMNHRLTGKEEGLMAYYPLNGDASDSTSNNNHGTIHGGTWTQENLEFLEPLKANI